MAEIETDLPPLKKAPRADFKEPALPAFQRKRGRHDDVISSDPPLFSSDDLPEAVENYTSDRPKRLRQGPWWTDAPNHQDQLVIRVGPKKKKREFTRNFDSGVWMGSDGTENSEEDQAVGAQSLEPSAAQVDYPGHFDEPSGDQGVLQNTQPSQDTSEPPPEYQKQLRPLELGEYLDKSGQESADRMVQKCVETGKEDVDLSSVKLSPL